MRGRRRRIVLFGTLLLFGGCAPRYAIDLPPRQPGADGGSAIEAEVRALGLMEREARLLDEILGGNVPAGSRSLVPVHLRGASSTSPEVTIWVAPDYLAVGSDADRWLVPLSPGTAQIIADSLGMVLPTSLMVDAIWAQAEVRLEPSPIDPSPEMTTTPVFLGHSRTIDRQHDAAGTKPGPLVAGHKKDVVISARLAEEQGRVAIYGWHLADGSPIQPLYLGHTDDWVDYSHGVRLVDRRALVDGEETDLIDALMDSAIAPLLSREGPIPLPRYGTQR